MVITVTLISLWLLLMLRSVIAEYKYYQSVKTLAPQVWQQLGTPAWFKLPIAFISPANAPLLNTIDNKTIQEHARKHQRAGRQFLLYVALVLAFSILYFNLA